MKIFSLLHDFKIVLSYGFFHTTFPVILDILHTEAIGIRIYRLKHLMSLILLLYSKMHDVSYTVLALILSVLDFPYKILNSKLRKIPGHECLSYFKIML